MTFKVKQDIKILDKTIPEGTILSVIDNKSIYDFGDGIKQELTLNYLNDNSDLFEKQSIHVEEISDIDDITKSWRLQLDVTCTKSDLKKIQTFIESNLNKILNVRR